MVTRDEGMITVVSGKDLFILFFLFESRALIVS